MPRNRGGLGKVSFPLISDQTKAISKSFGVLIEEEGFVKLIYLGVSLRGTFIIDPVGVVRQITMNDMQVGKK
jgi:alkyl hydroperoxide reductase subunit AhpC